MYNPQRPRHAFTLLLALAFLASACGESAGSTAGTPDASPSDAAPDATVKPPVDAPMDAPMDTATVDVPADLPDDTPQPPPDLSDDAPSDVGVDAPVRCASADDCRGDPATPACDTATGRCVQCVAAMDACPAAQHCDDASHTCVAGCRSDEGCADTVGDAGADGGAGERRRCDTATHACVECVTGAHCGAGRLCVGSVCVAGCDTAHPCPTGQACCSGACVDTQANVAHCGMCDARCMVTNGTAACMNGRCAVGACAAPHADCNATADDGCEVNTHTTLGHCGRCGNACAARAGSTASCVAGACAYACEAGRGDCDGDASNGCEADLVGDPAHCGGCSMRCDLPNATAACAMGRCAVARCATGRADCDMSASNGCEVDTTSSAAHCGACDRQCPARPNAFPDCVAGACVMSCVAGFADCDGAAENGCEVDLRTTAAHCGACSRRCAPANATGVCAMSACAIGACEAGFADCNGRPDDGCEARPGMACAPTDPCRSGAIACRDGAAACVAGAVRPPGTSCGAGMVCNAAGACVACVAGAACDTGNPCTTGATSCATGAPVCVTTGNRTANTPCGTNRICNPSGTCVESVITGTVSCPARTVSGNELCRAAGFTGASTANGYWWGQCAGTLDRCPGGWQGDGTTCPNWCAGTDCVGLGFCSGGFGWSVRQRLGSGATTFHALEFGLDCSSWNPGWTVRLRCFF